MYGADQWSNREISNVRVWSNYLASSRKNCVFYAVLSADVDSMEHCFFSAFPGTFSKVNCRAERSLGDRFGGDEFGSIGTG